MREVEDIRATESCDALRGRRDAVTVKSDQPAGLTPTLIMVAQAERLGLDVGGRARGATSLSMAPRGCRAACAVIHLDGRSFRRAVPAIGTADSLRREFSIASVTKAIIPHLSDSI